MPTNLDRLRSELEGKLQPPVDVMLDPSLLVATTTLDRLADSTLFDAQTQATLGQTPTEPRVDDIHVPAPFRRLFDAEGQTDVPTTATWNFYRGQAETAPPEEIGQLLDSYDMRDYDDDTTTGLHWAAALDEAHHSDRLIATLETEYAFLAEGGVLLSRTPTSLDALRDAGVASIDLGRAELVDTLHDRLTDIGYRDPATICALGLASASAVVDGLVGTLLGSHADLLLYRLGR